ncbi:MAG TPA: branched-chain amino acid ABC transporter permease [Gaiellaceae bacterium]
MSLLAVTIAFLRSTDFWIGVGILISTYGILALGLQLNLGTTGIANFGAAGFMAIGAYAMGILVVKAHLSFWLAMVLGVLVAIAAAIVVGLPSLRLRADYFAIATLAFAEITRYLIDPLHTITAGHEGLIGYDTTWLRMSIRMSRWLHSVGIDASFLLPLMLVSWGIFLLLVIGFWLLNKTPWARVLRAIREDEDAAAALGKNTLVCKLQSLSLAAAVAAIAGYIFALNVTILVPETFDPVISIFGYLVIILGGLGSYWGVIFGAVLLLTMMEGTRFLGLPLPDEKVAALRFLIVGLILIALMAFRPQGVFGKRDEMILGD